MKDKIGRDYRTTLHDCPICGTEFLARTRQIYCTKRCKWKMWQLRKRKVGPRMRPIGDMPVLSDIEIGYFAGIIDGEGSVSIYSAGRGLLSTEISIFNTDVRMLNYLHSLLPKSQKPARMTASRKKSTSNWKRAYRLSIRRMPVIQWLLKQVLPFLRIKKEQAELLLAFIESRQKASLYHPSTEEHRYSKKDYEIVERMHMLNHRGNKPYIQTRIYPK